MQSPLHETWRQEWEELRENSLSFQMSNPLAVELSAPTESPRLIFTGNTEAATQQPSMALSSAAIYSDFMKWLERS